MSPKKQPANLSLSCLKLLSNQIIYALSDDEESSYHIADIKNFMNFGTYDTLQAILKNILDLINLDANTRFSCLQALLRKDVKILETGIFPRFYYDKILETIRDKGKGLNQLNLKGVWVRDYPKLLTELIYELKHLKSLIIPHMADDSVINSILTLKNLIKLDISGEACYTPEGIKNLKSDSIRILDIGGFGKPNLCPDSTRNNYELVSEIIKNLPNLCVIKTYSFTGHALFFLHNMDNNFKTKLTYIHATNCSWDILQAILNTCPLLENIHLNCPQDDGVIEGLCSANKLNSLKITKGNSNELINLLKNRGDFIQNLKLNHFNSSYIDLSEISNYATNLNSLECYQTFMNFNNLDFYCMNLEKVQLFYCNNISDDVIRTILTNSPFLRTFNVGCGIQMTDGDMFRLLGDCTLENLEELLFSEARFLSTISVQLLAENCPKLKILGSLIGWDISREEIDALRMLLTLSNTDLTLYPINIY